MIGGVAVVITSTLLLLWFLDNPYHRGRRRAEAGRDGADARVARPVAPLVGRPRAAALRRSSVRPALSAASRGRAVRPVHLAAHVLLGAGPRRSRARRSSCSGLTTAAGSAQPPGFQSPERRNALLQWEKTCRTSTSITNHGRLAVDRAERAQLGVPGQPRPIPFTRSVSVIPGTMKSRPMPGPLDEVLHAVEPPVARELGHQQPRLVQHAHEPGRPALRRRVRRAVGGSRCEHEERRGADERRRALVERRRLLRDRARQRLADDGSQVGDARHVVAPGHRHATKATRPRHARGSAARPPGRSLGGR